MIKTLIEELAYDKISLTQALTRAKIISFRIDNLTFQTWLKKELEGYSNTDVLPDYRVIRCEVSLTVSNGYRTQNIPVDFDWQEMKDMLTKHKEIRNIPNLEENYLLLTSDTGFMPFDGGLIRILNEMYTADGTPWQVVKGGQVIGKLKLKQIIDLTKQKLIDTLLELDKEFPDLINNSAMSKDKNEKIQNIITNNIYGSNNPLNVAAGENVNQYDFNFATTDFSELKKLGVENNQIEELKSILNENKSDQNNLKSKTLKWLGSVSTAIAARGLYDNIPALNEFIHTYILT